MAVQSHAVRACNAPATFERLMETVLKGLTFEACLIYLDDVVIGGRTFEEHLQNIRKVLSKLSDANLKLNPSKCKFFQKEVNYLGHIISAEGVRTDPEKVSALKEALTSLPILIYPQPDKPFILDTDASNVSVGAVLSQEIDGQERVVAYWKVLKELHGSPTGGHFFMKTLHRVRERFCWGKVRADVEQWCKSCDACSARKGPKIRSRGKLHRYNVGAPFERIAFDILGPLQDCVCVPQRRSRDYRIFTIPDAFWPRSVSPCDLLFGRPPAPSSPEEYVQNLQARFEDVHNLARERINLRTEKMKIRYDTKATGHQFKEGDKVWFYNPTRRKGLFPKLQSHWDGPYTILKIINDVGIRIRKSTNSKPRVVHYDRLAPYYGHNS
ncbi:retrovirus-related Pol polyprotein from transposon 297 [Trichonephila clavipes]|nr:retrovirus-related Pol polyprotein from transposon 297 [Trichonephila clavipes]